MSDDISPPTLNLLCRELTKIHEWEKLAVYLELPDHVIQDAKVCYPHGGIWEFKKHCLQKWLDQTNTVHSWDTVVKAVEEVNPAVAENIRTKYATILDLVPYTSQNTEYSSVNAYQNDSITEEQQQIKCVTVDVDKCIVDKITDLKDQFAM